ncbi:MAG: hypothetical protein ACK5NN_00280 [Sphingomonadaceae bacterium]
MIQSNWYELALIAFILGGIGIVLWRGGAANPVGTGRLGRQLGKLDDAVKGLDAKVERLEQQVDDIDRRAATVDDIGRIEAQLQALARDVATIRENDAMGRVSAEHVRRQVDALYEVIVKKGMDA